MRGATVSETRPVYGVFSNGVQPAAFHSIQCSSRASSASTSAWNAAPPGGIALSSTPHAPFSFSAARPSTRLELAAFPWWVTV